MLWLMALAPMFGGCAARPDLNTEVNKIITEMNRRIRQPDLSKVKPRPIARGPEKPDYEKALALSRQVTELKVEVVEPGSGPELTEGLWVNLQYVGRFMDGYIFENSEAQGGQRLHVQYVPGQVIPGLYQGLRGIRVGERRIITIPAHLAYGEEGSRPKIPPNMALRFDVYCLWVGR